MIVFNTGRPYTVKGQRIAAEIFPEVETIIFVDVDRGIQGVISTFGVIRLTQQEVMDAYDRCQYVHPIGNESLIRELTEAAQQL